TYDEWLEVFDAEPDVWAEMFRHGSELLHHPQMVHDHRTVVVEDPTLGPVRQPAPLMRMHGTPLEVPRPAPSIDADGATARAGTAAAAPGQPEAGPAAPDPAPPLHGITVIELGTFYAAPFGTTILADLGARVIKVEQLDGDPLRNVVPFPEIGAIKAL